MTCRDEILKAIKYIVNRKGNNLFTIPEVISIMAQNGTEYKESTIRTHITSRMCANAPENHGVTYEDIERVDRGLYKLR